MLNVTCDLFLPIIIISTYNSMQFQIIPPTAQIYFEQTLYSVSITRSINSRGTNPWWSPLKHHWISSSHTLAATDWSVSAAKCLQWESRPHGREDRVKLSMSHTVRVLSCMNSVLVFMEYNAYVLGAYCHNCNCDWLFLFHHWPLWSSLSSFSWRFPTRKNNLHTIVLPCILVYAVYKHR